MADLTWYTKGAADNLLAAKADTSALNVYAKTADLATVATSGSYSDLTDQPTLGTAAAQDTTAFATAAQGTLATNAVPNTRTVNGKALSADVTLAASDVSAVPTTRMVNGNALSADVTLDASDVNARPDTWVPSASDVGALPTAIGSTATSNVVVVANGATAPSGLPDGTVIVELSA